MTGRLAVVLIALAALLGGGTMYYLQVYAYYERSQGGAVALAPAGGGAPVVVPATEVAAIDAGSSPLRYRACFSQDLDPAAFEPYPSAAPTVGPGWFGCYDAGEADAAIEAGEAVAVLATRDVTYGVDRVAALFADGRGMIWHQLNRCGEAVYGGREPPAGCPTPPEAYRAEAYRD